MRSIVRIAVATAIYFALFVFAASALAQEPRRTIDNPKPKIVLTVIHGSLAFTDTAYTQSLRGRGFVEHDFLAREVVKHRGLAYGLAGAETFGAAWLGGRMRRSQHWHPLWWVPQTAGILGHAYALSRTLERQHGSP